MGFECGQNELSSPTLLYYMQFGDPLESRQKEEELRGPAVMELTYCINSFREAAQSKDAKFDHIDAADKEKVCVIHHKMQSTLFSAEKCFFSHGTSYE